MINKYLLMLYVVLFAILYSNLYANDEESSLFRLQNYNNSALKVKYLNRDVRMYIERFNLKFPAIIRKVHIQAESEKGATAYL